MTTFAEKATHYVEMGWPVIPQGLDKKPLIKGWRDLRVPTMRQIEVWNLQWPDANVALLTGRTSGIFVIDLDSDAAITRWKDIKVICNLAREPPTVVTRRGLHLYYRTVGYVKSQSPSKLGKGIDIRGEGGMATLPPSKHESGHVYAWQGQPDFSNIPMPTPSTMRMIAGFDPVQGRKPVQLINEVSVERAIDRLKSTTEGGRNRQLYSAAFVAGKAVRARQITEMDAWRLLKDAGRDVGLTQTEIMATIRSGLHDGEKA
jgi:hypothetical protein